MKFRLQAKYTLTILSLILVIVPILSGALLMEFQRSMQEVTRASADSVATDLLGQLENVGPASRAFSRRASSTPSITMTSMSSPSS